MVNISIKGIERQYELYKKRMRKQEVIVSFREFKKAIEEVEKIESKRKK